MYLINILLKIYKHYFYGKFLYKNEKITKILDNPISKIF